MTHTDVRSVREAKYVFTLKPKQKVLLPNNQAHTQQCTTLTGLQQLVQIEGNCFPLHKLEVLSMYAHVTIQKHD